MLRRLQEARVTSPGGYGTTTINRTAISDRAPGTSSRLTAAVDTRRDYAYATAARARGSPGNERRSIGFPRSPSSPWTTDTQLGGSGRSGGSGGGTRPISGLSGFSLGASLEERLAQERLLSLPRPRETFVGGSPINLPGVGSVGSWRDSDRAATLPRRDPKQRDRISISSVSSAAAQERRPSSILRPEVVVENKESEAAEEKKIHDDASPHEAKKKQIISQNEEGRERAVQQPRSPPRPLRPPTPSTTAAKTSSKPTTAIEKGRKNRAPREELHGGGPRTHSISSRPAVTPASPPKWTAPRAVAPKQEARQLAFVVTHDTQRVDETKPALKSLDHWGLLGTVIRDECELAGCPLL